MIKYVSTYTKGTLKQGSAKDLSNDAYVIFLCFVFLIFIIKAYVVGTRLNCINKLMQFKWVPGTHNICLNKEVDKKYTGCNLKTYRGMCGN